MAAACEIDCNIFQMAIILDLIATTFQHQDLCYLYKILRSRELLQPTTCTLSHSCFLLSEIKFQMNRNSTPVRFPVPNDEDQLLLPFESFPEECLATNQDSALTDFLRIEPKVKPSARPRFKVNQRNFWKNWGRTSP
jgi:hypothetical protein